MPMLVDLFAGGGGVAQGARLAGLDSAGVELDESAVAVARAAGHLTEHANVVDVNKWTTALRLACADIVGWWASPPCQGWSTAGSRAGAAGGSNGWPMLLRALDVSAAAGRPAPWLLVENVRGMTQHRSPAWARTHGLRPCGNGTHPLLPVCAGCYLGWVLTQLRARFAHVEMRVLDAADFGVPQHRRRMFIAAGPAPFDWPAPTHGPDGALPYETMRTAIGDTLADGRFVRHEGGSARPRSLDEPAVTVSTKGTLYVHRDDPGAHGGGTARSARAAFPELLDRPSLTVTTCEDKGTRGDAMFGKTRVGKQRGGPDRASDIAWLATGVRRLSVDECGRLQAFPRGYPFDAARTVREQYRVVGNAVPPPLAAVLFGAAGRSW